MRSAARALAGRLLSRSATLLLAAGLGVIAPGCQGNTALLAEAYVDAHDERAAAFCRCFGPLAGYETETETADGMVLAYTDRDRDRCTDNEQFAEQQRVCMIDMFTSGVEFSPDDTLACLLAAETAYTLCLEALACEDIPGYDACTTEFYEDSRACPSLSERDAANFFNCSFV